ncbi:hypothetical protein GJ496_011055 [Pomphorhynchus laevis]|nr:hypothetical protein GJ496_011055 [Pomphorhynchus laevis]
MVEEDNDFIDVQLLRKMSEEVRENAYAPFSNFKVGVVVSSKDGRKFTGCNVENSSYGLTICAEQVAITKAVSEGAREFTCIFINCGRENGLSSPCGACRQIIAEFSPMKIILCDGISHAMNHYLFSTPQQHTSDGYQKQSVNFLMQHRSALPTMRLKTSTIPALRYTGSTSSDAIEITNIAIDVAKRLKSKPMMLTYVANC